MIDGAASAQRILYSSMDGLDMTRLTFVSGTVYLPQGDRPKQGWPIMAWCHGTLGVADKCAPSWSPRAEDRRLYLGRWLKQGFAVAASDYQGLGTPGPHPYLVFRAEGNSTLDCLRAALAGWPELDNRIVLVGQSQGGGAALGAAWLAPFYAGELNLAGTVALGAVADFKDRAGAMRLDVPVVSDDYPHAAAYEALFLLGTMRALNPSLKLEDYVTQQGYELLEFAATHLWEEIKAQAEAMKINLSRLYKSPGNDLNRFYEAVWKIPHAYFSSPVFIGAGLEDEAVVPARQFNNVAAMCAAGTRVEAHFYPGQNHGSTVNHSFDDALEFAGRMIAGKESNPNCGSVLDFARMIEDPAKPEPGPAGD